MWKEATPEMIEARARQLADADLDYYGAAFGEGAEDLRAADASTVRGHEFTSAENDRAYYLALEMLEDLEEADQGEEGEAEPAEETAQGEPARPRETLTGDIDSRITTALLISKDITEAADLAGVSRQTVYNKLKRPEFAERLEHERTAVALAVRGEIGEAVSNATYEAIGALVEIARGGGSGGWMGLETPTAADRIKAALAILDAYSWIEG